MAWFCKPFKPQYAKNLISFLRTPEEDYEEILSVLRDDESVYRGGLSPVVLPSLQKKAVELLAANGFTLDPSSDAYTHFLWLLIRAGLENMQPARERYSGNPTEPVFDRMFATTGAETSAPSSSSGGLLLRKLIERYENDLAWRGLAEKTQQAYSDTHGALQPIAGMRSGLAPCKHSRALRLVYNDILLVNSASAATQAGASGRAKPGYI